VPADFTPGIQVTLSAASAVPVSAIVVPANATTSAMNRRRIGV
jgi:hypothetical protein